MLVLFTTLSHIDIYHGLTGSAVGHRFIAPWFKPQLGYVRRMFHLSLRFITFGVRPAHLATKVALKQQHFHMKIF